MTQSDLFLIFALVLVAPHLEKKTSMSLSKWAIAGAIFFGLPDFVSGLGLIVADIMTVLQ